MKFKRRRKNNKQLLLTQLFLVLLLFITIGYSVLNTHLGINGTVQLAKATCKVGNKLYNVIKCEAEEGTLAKKYTGSHNDTLDNTGTQDIYYYYGSNNTNGTAIRDKYNVKLGNMCFQMLRTTDTGGVKLIYNGEYDSTNKCNDSRGTHKGVIGTQGSTETLNSSYMYGDIYSYDLNTGNFTLQNTTTATWSDSTANNLIGKYTCKTATNTCTTLYGVNGYSNNTTAYTTSYTIGDTEYSHIGKTPFNANRNSPAMVGYMFNTVYNYKGGSAASGTVYGNDVTYSGGQYTLTNISTTRDNTHHYSCNNTTGICTNVRFIYHVFNNNTEYYIELTGGTKIEDAVNEMLHADNVNTKNSNVKALIEVWYRQNMTSYTNKLEDVVYCNDRSQSNADVNGWNKNGSLSTYMYFKSRQGTDLSCSNITDKFTTANTKAQSAYPVGLITSPEMYLLNNNNARNYYWLGSPNYFHRYSALERGVNVPGSMINFDVDDYRIGARPAVSLVPGVEFSTGTGTMNDPYVIKLD